MNHLPELRKKPVVADVQSVPAEPFVEVRVGQRLMAVTVECPDVAASQLELTLTRSTLRLQSCAGAPRLHVFVPLPVTAEPGRYWMRFNHGVCDILIARAEKSD